MIKFEKGNEIMFLSDLNDSKITKNIYYKILKTEKYKRNNQENFFLTILDDTKNVFRFKITDSLQIKKREKHWLELEYEILQKISICLKFRDETEKSLHLEISNFQKISKTSSNIFFKELVAMINSKDYLQEKAFTLIQLLEDYLEDETDKIGIKIGNNLYVQETKEENDSTDYEQIIMNSFRNGEQDRFGYQKK